MSGDSGHEVKASTESEVKVPTTSEVQARWDKFASLYDQHFRLWSLPAYYALLSALDVGAPSVRSCLEVGCGPGHFIAPLRAELPAAASHIATDFSEEMVARAQGASKGMVGVEVRVADAQRLPPEFDVSFDRALACLCLHLVPDADAAIAELFRVCRPGGLVGAAVWGKRASSAMFTVFDEAVGECRRLGRLPKPESSGTSRSPFYLGQDDALLPGKFAEAGFEDVVTFHVACPFPAGSGAKGAGFAAVWLRLMPDAIALMEKLDAASKEALEREVAARADDVTRQGSPLACDVLCVVGRRGAGDSGAPAAKRLKS